MLRGMSVAIIIVAPIKKTCIVACFLLSVARQQLPAGRVRVVKWAANAKCLRARIRINGNNCFFYRL